MRNALIKLLVFSLIFSCFSSFQTFAAVNNKTVSEDNKASTEEAVTSGGSDTEEESSASASAKTNGGDSSGRGSGDGKPTSESDGEDDQDGYIPHAKYEDAVKVLMDLGVVTGYEDGGYHPENIVTRAEMAVLTVNALGMKDYVSEDAKSTFSDLAGYGWAEGYISYAQGLGVVAGYEDGTFRPGKTVSHDEAVTMLVAALGYTPQTLTGTWPVNYVSKGKSLGILDDIASSSEGADRGDIAVMLYQSLNQAIGTVDNSGNWVGTAAAFHSDGSVKSYDTMLSRLGARHANGGEPFVITDSIARNDAIINLYPHLGAYVIAYENKNEEIIAIAESKSEFLTGQLKSGKFKVGKTEYAVTNTRFEGGKDTDSAISFYNGEEDGTVTKLTNNQKVTIAADYSGKAIKAIYSVTQWDMESGEHGLFTEQTAYEIENKQSIFGIDLPRNNYGDIAYDAFSLLGVNSLEDLKEDHVVYVYYNKDDEITRITVGTKTVTGKVTVVTGDYDLDSEYTVDGTSYDYAKENAVSSDTEFPKPGDTAKLYLNYDGDIYKSERTADSLLNYAVVLDTDVYAGSGSTFDNDRIKLFLPSGKSTVFEIDDSITVTINGEKQSDATVAIGGLVSGDLIEYSTSGGMVDEVVIVKEGLYENRMSNQNISKKGYFDGKAIENNAVIFTLDDDKFGSLSGSSKNTDYSVTTLSKVLDTKADQAIYVMDKNNIVAMLINAGASGDNDLFGVMVSQAHNDSETGQEVRLLVNGSQATYDAKKTVYDTANKTDLYKIKLDSSDVVTGLDAQTSVMETGYAAGANFKVSGYKVTVGDSSYLTKGHQYLSKDSFALHQDVIVYIYSSGKFKAGNLSDITAAKGTVSFYITGEDGAIDHVLIRNDKVDNPYENTGNANESGDNGSNGASGEDSDNNNGSGDDGNNGGDSGDNNNNEGTGSNETGKENPNTSADEKDANNGSGSSGNGDSSGSGNSSEQQDE